MGWMIDTAKLLLCITMIFTFPLPFFTCRELLILTVIHPFCGIDRIYAQNESADDQLNEIRVENENDGPTDLQCPLLTAEESHDVADDADSVVRHNDNDHVDN